MGIFDKIKHAILGEAVAAPVDARPPRRRHRRLPQRQAPRRQPHHSRHRQPRRPPRPAIDIVPLLDAAVKKSGQKLDWRRSIVDLMKAVGMDASFAERKELAAELGFTGDHARHRHDERVPAQGTDEAPCRKTAERFRPTFSTDRRCGSAAANFLQSFWLRPL